ncbi:MAG: hypothetical protein EBU62_04180, partial [Proteobacteria bacterium]|nr:hypothetical protein [Pseudomonadota bacterium]
MFDIGVPELAVIAIVALVVLGPERLPEVMRQAGKLYRQVSTWRQQLMADVQEQIRAGMKEVEEVSATLNSAFQFGESNSGADPSLPPPPLRQVPALRLQPAKAYDAGPFTLAAWYRDTSPEVVLAPGPHGTRSRVNAQEAFALPQTTSDPLFGNAYVTSTASLISPVHPFDDPFSAGEHPQERRSGPVQMIVSHGTVGHGTVSRLVTASHGTANQASRRRGVLPTARAAGRSRAMTAPTASAAGASLAVLGKSGRRRTDRGRRRRRHRGLALADDDKLSRRRGRATRRHRLLLRRRCHGDRRGRLGDRLINTLADRRRRGPARRPTDRHDNSPAAGEDPG